MKKSVLALAVLGAFAGTAAAQSSVTLYGRLDTAVVYTNPGSDAGDSRWAVTGGGTGQFAPIGGSRWGLRGSEDLGGGLRANFVLESGFDSDTGAGKAKLFDRAAWVGLASASLGEVRLGRHETLTRQLNVFGVTDITNEGEITISETINGIAGRPLYQNFGTRVDNAIVYLSPSFSGFQVRGLVALGEGATARQQGVMATYSGGPLKAGIVYEAYGDAPDTNGALAPNPASGSYNEVLTLGASYNFGVATVLAGYQRSNDFGGSTAGANSDIDHDAYSVGVLVPFGAFEFRAQYINSTVEDAAGVETDQKKVGASVRYALSKRTTLYTALLKRSGDADSTFTRETEFGVGIGHNF